jgi:CubicO group peptidase (beta-lactamase class C family)
MDIRLLEAAAKCAAERLAQHRAGGQMVVLWRGEVVWDQSFGHGLPPDPLFLIYSASKPLVAMVIHRLVEDGQLSLDESIASYWPEFGQHGKQTITARMVLTHRAGVPLDSGWATLLTMPNWQASVRRMERLRPRYQPGSVVAYHALTYGFILGELARRVTGTPIARLLEDQLLRPLGLQNTHLGLPAAECARAVPVIPAGSRGELVNALIFNRRRYRRAIIPAASISSTARDLARFYEMLRRGGELDGVRVLAHKTVAQALEPAAAGPEWDRLLGRRVRWAHGFHLGGVSDSRDIARCMGQLSGPKSFGHNGNACCSAWADPERELVFVYLTNLLLSVDQGLAHHGQVSDYVLQSCAEPS